MKKYLHILFVVLLATAMCMVFASCNTVFNNGNENSGTSETSTIDEIVDTTPNSTTDTQSTTPAAPEHTHNYLATVTEPTCEEEGYTTHTCSCGDSFVDEITAALGHTEQTVEGTDATCTESGLTDGKKCSVCDVVLVAQETIPALGHTEQTVEGTDATCTESGLTDGKKCSVCDVVLVAQETIPALGHTEQTVEGTDATCTESGLTDGKKCSVCGVVLVAQETIPALGHNYVDRKCDRCGADDPDSRDFDIAVSSQKTSLEDLTFTINGEEMKGQNYARDDGGYTYHLIPKVKNGDVMTVSVNLPARCRFKLFYLRDVNGAIIEEVTTNSITFTIDSTTGSLDLRIEELDYLGMQVDGQYVGWNNFNVNMHTGVHYTTVIKGTEETGPADFDVWVYTDDQEYLLTPDQYILDTDGFDINACGVYEVKYTLVEDPGMSVLLIISVVVEEEMVNIDFSTIPDGEQYTNEKVTVGEATVSTYNNGCYFAGQLRIYDNATSDGYAVVKAPYQISSLTFEAGYNNATLEIYVSYDGETWFHREDVNVTKDYATYTVTFNPNEAYGYLKFDAVGGQIRIKNLVANRVASGSPATFLVYAETEIDYTPMGSVAISYDGKTFSNYEDYIVESRYGLDTTFFVLRQQPKEGYKFVGWYFYGKYPDGASRVFLLSTEDEVTMGLETPTTVRIEARYVAE